MSKQVDAKVSPEALQTILLDEISSRLADIHSELIAQTPKGNLYTLPVNVSTLGIKVVLLYTATIYNDGPADIYVLRDYNRELDASDVPLKMTDSLIIDLKRQTNKTYWLKTKAATASARIFALE